MANEKRLIDANAYPCQTCEVSYCYKNCEKFNAWFNKTVDAVEVCRCKDCKHWLHVDDGFGDCTNPRYHLPGHADPTMNADDFCSCGERRTE